MAKDGAMPTPSETKEVKKYRLGNQDQEYELVTKYLGWLPEQFPSWDRWSAKALLKERSEQLEQLVIISPDKTKKVTLIMHHQLSKDAFPLSFFGEERTQNWFRFYKVSEEKNPDVQFVIPLH